MADEPPRSRTARAAAERALIRVVHHYGERPEFVLLGGLVPDLLCSTSGTVHSGTTDVDVQVNLEIAAGTFNAQRLERALLNAEFEPDTERVWRWRTGDGDDVAMMIVAIWWMLTNSVDYVELGGDYFEQRTDQAAQTRRLVRQLERLGHQVSLTPAA